MLSRGAVWGLVVLLASCAGGEETHPETTVFRVGATQGLSPIAPGSELYGSSAAAADLVYDPLDVHVSRVVARGRVVTMTRRPDSAFTAAELAAAFRFPGLESTAVHGERIEATFPDRTTAERAVDPAHFAAFEVGPYRIDSQAEGALTLRRRRPGGVEVIEVVSISAADEWRKLMARELDVMPFSPDLYRDQFDGMRSVRLLDVPATLVVTLYFNVRSPSLARPELRRRLAAGLNRHAIARIATGSPDSAVGATSSSGPAEEAGPPPPRLSLLVGEDDSTLLLAASVLRHQFDRMGVTLEVEAVAVDVLLARVDSGDRELVLAPLPLGPRGFTRFVSPEPGGSSLSNLASPELDAAVAAGRLERAQAILDREAPAVPLYESRGFAAIDARFCGGVKPTVSSWRWMAELRPCEEGDAHTEERP